MTTPIDTGGRKTRFNRRSIRLKGYDYSQAGAYFITIVAQDRMHLFGEVGKGEMQLNAAGRMILAEWEALPQRFPTVEIDAFVVMPNHVHGIVIITDGPGVVGAGSEPAPTTPATAHTARHGLPEIVRQFKTFSARRINALRGTPGVSVWQRNYYEHIIRNDEALERIRRYILENPARWMRDREKPRAIRPEPEDTWAQ